MKSSKRNPLQNLTRGIPATEKAIRKLTRQYPEQKISTEFAKYIERNHPDLLCTASLVGVKLPVQVAARAKSMGVKKGWPDWFIARCRMEPIYKSMVCNGQEEDQFRTGTKLFFGLFIELKSERGRPSKDQKALHEKLTREGYKVVVATGLQEAIDALEEYLR